MLKSEKRDLEEQTSTSPAAEKKPLDWDKILAYVTLAFLALVAFNFGGNQWTYLYEAIGFVIAVAYFAVLPSQKNKAEEKRFLLYSIPLIVFAVFCSFSKFWLGSGFASFSSALINVMGILAFYVLGFLSHHVKALTLEKVVLAVLSGLALLVLISLIASLVDYGFFYVVRYSGMVRYYDGVPYAISDEYSLLYGFKILGVSLRYSMQFAFVLSISLLSLLFISPTKNKRLFIGVAVAGGIGLLAMILTPYVFGFKLAIPFVIFALLLRFVKFPQATPKWEKIVGYAVLGLGFLFLLIMFINGLKGGIAVLTSGFLGKVFNNRLLTVANETVAVAFHKASGGFDITGLFGIGFSETGEWLGQSVNESFFVTNRVFEFAALYEGGLLGFLGLFAMLVFAIISFRKYLHLDETLDGGKILILLLVASYVLYASLASDSTPLKEGSSSLYVSPLARNGMILLLVYFLGYAYTPIFPLSKKGKVEANDND
jgi:hypothetical protein